MPVSDVWKNLAAGGFSDYKLKVGGLVENPVELSLADIEKLGETEHIAMHHCIQGWSGIAKWGGIPMKTIIELVHPEARSQGCSLLLFWGSTLWRCLLRHAEYGECADVTVRASIPDERRTAFGGVRASVAPAR